MTDLTLPKGYSIRIIEGSAYLYRGKTTIDHYCDEKLAAEHAWEIHEEQRQEQIDRDAAVHGPWGAPYPPTPS